MTRWADIEGTYVDLDQVHAVKFFGGGEFDASATATLVTSGGEIPIHMTLSHDDVKEIGERVAPVNIDVERPEYLAPPRRFASRATKQRYEEYLRPFKVWSDTLRDAQGVYFAAQRQVMREIAKRKFDALIERVAPAIDGVES